MNLLKIWSDENEYNIEYPDYSFAIKFYPFTGNDLDTVVKYEIFRDDGLAEEQDYTSFNEKFPAKKILWKKVAEEINNIIRNNTEQEIYLNTHGHGVPYLHVRIDPSPKYGYNFLK